MSTGLGFEAQQDDYFCRAEAFGDLPALPACGSFFCLSPFLFVCGIPIDSLVVLRLVCGDKGRE